MRDLPFLGGEQLRGDRGIQDIPQDSGQLRIAALGLIGGVGGEVAHQSLGDGGVDAVHGHMVAIVGGPAQGQFAEVPGADDQSPTLVGHIHQHLGALPSLAVLKGDGKIFHRLADIPEVDLYRLADVHRVELCAHAFGQDLSIGFGASGGAEAGHGDGQNV